MKNDFLMSFWFDFSFDTFDLQNEEIQYPGVTSNCRWSARSTSLLSEGNKMAARYREAGFILMEGTSKRRTCDSVARYHVPIFVFAPGK